MGKISSKESILVVDDSQDTLEMLRRYLTSDGYRVYTAPSVPEAIKFLEEKLIDLVITDLKMPKVSGLDLVRYVRENCEDSEIIMITGYATVNGAVEAVKVGAEDYLAKPFTHDELRASVSSALEKLSIRLAATKHKDDEIMQPYGLSGSSEPMWKVYEIISKAARTPATVLITGESGTGKELVARAIHYASGRASEPFVPVNCGGIPEELLESELFGHVKGAFTGASQSRAGFFQTADGGTIFLDEISETSISMQVKLLRVVQDKEVYMVGARKPQKVDVRIIAATNKDLFSMVRNGTFREDLYYRLNVINISLPPLRERGDDLLILTDHFLKKFAGELGIKPPTFSDRALKILKEYDWPGNVRELENLIQRLVVMVEGEKIDATDLPSSMRFSAPIGSGLERTLAEVEAEYIANVLEKVGGNKSYAAEILGIDRKTLRKKLQKFNKLE